MAVDFEFSYCGPDELQAAILAVQHGLGRSRAMADPLYVPGVGLLRIPDYLAPREEASAGEMFGHLFEHFTAGDLPFPLPNADPHTFLPVWIRTPEDLKNLRRAWLRRKVQYHQRLYKLVDRLKTVLSDIQDPSKGTAEERRQLCVRTCNSVDTEDAVFEILLSQQYDGTSLDTTTLATEKDHHQAVLVDTAKHLVSIITDGSGYPATSAQQAAIEKVFAARAAGRLAVSAAATSSVAGEAAIAAVKAMYLAVHIVGSPVWNTTGLTAVLATGRSPVAWSSGSASITGLVSGHLSTSQVEFRGGEWSLTNSAGKLVLTWTGEGEAPPLGAHELDLVARNATGASILPVTINVPDLLPSFTPSTLIEESIDIPEYRRNPGTRTVVLPKAAGGNGRLTYFVEGLHGADRINRPFHEFLIDYHEDVLVIPVRPGSAVRNYTLAVYDEDGSKATRPFRVTLTERRG